MDKLKYLSKNIALFTISNFVSKILVFLLVPFYTNVLTTYEYGIADIVQVTLLLLVPAMTVNVGEAALRFGIEKSDKRNSIFHTGVKYLLRADLLVTIICIVAAMFVNSEIKVYVGFFMLLFLANALYEFLILYFQGSELVPIVVVGSVTCTAITICSNLIFLLVIKLSLNGYFISQLIAYTLSACLMIALGKKAEVIGRKEIDLQLEKEMITYSRPMVVYSTASWVNNAVDRYLVAGLCGAAINGIYGVAYKIPAILMVFQRIFAQAWQMSATKSYGDENSDRFFSGMYKAYNTFMVIGCSFLILIVKPLAAFLFRKDFYEAWVFVPMLLISVIFGALTGFLGSICLAHKDSKSMGIATGTGAVINVILNILFIPKYGALGAAVATAISYFTMSMMAYVFVRKHTELNVNIVKNIIAYIIIVVQSIIMISEIKNHFIYCGVIVIVLIFIYMKETAELLLVVKNKFADGKGDKSV